MTRTPQAQAYDQERLSAAQLQAMQLYPYLCRAILAMHPVFSEARRTMAVDPEWRLYINPVFLESLSVDEAAACLIHEATHLTMRHYMRGQSQGVGSTEATIWNVATDCEINSGLRSNKMTLPNIVVYPEHFELPDGHLGEEYYPSLLERALKNKQQAVQQGQGQGQGQGPPKAGSGQGQSPPGAGGAGTAVTGGVGAPMPGGTGGQQPGPGRVSGDLADYLNPQGGGDEQSPRCGSGSHGVPDPNDLPQNSKEHPGLNEDQKGMLERAVAEDIKNYEQAHGIGSTSETWGKWAGKILHSTVDWRQHIRGFMLTGIASMKKGAFDITYRRRSKQFALGGSVVMPAWTDFDPEIAIVIDKSGSVDHKMMGQFLGEVDAILSRLGLRDVPILPCNVEVDKVLKTSNVRTLNFNVGGGTNMGEGIAKAARLRPRPNLILVFTDGMTPWPQSPPAKTKVIVGVVGVGAWMRDVPGWAKAVHIDMSDEVESIGV